MEPEYVLIKDTGPPHARIFTIQCKVSNFVEEGVQSTKKQAKHEAARKMVDRIKGLVNQMNSTEDREESLNSSVVIDETEIMNRTAKEYYHTLSKSTRKINLGIRLAEYHTKWRDSLEEDKRNKILEELNCINFNKISDDTDQSSKLIKETLSRLETILLEIDVTINTKDILADNNYFMEIIELNTCPFLTQIGMGTNKQEAFWNALSRMIDCLKLLLS